jgi:hypothetical protein
LRVAPRLHLGKPMRPLLLALLFSCSLPGVAHAGPLAKLWQRVKRPLGGLNKRGAPTPMQSLSARATVPKTALDPAHTASTLRGALVELGEAIGNNKVFSGEAWVTGKEIAATDVGSPVKIANVVVNLSTSPYRLAWNQKGLSARGPLLRHLQALGTSAEPTALLDAWGKVLKGLRSEWPGVVPIVAEALSQLAERTGDPHFQRELTVLARDGFYDVQQNANRLHRRGETDPKLEESRLRLAQVMVAGALTSPKNREMLTKVFSTLWHDERMSFSDQAVLMRPLVKALVRFPREDWRHMFSDDVFGPGARYRDPLLAFNPPSIGLVGHKTQSAYGLLASLYGYSDRVEERVAAVDDLFRHARRPPSADLSSFSLTMQKHRVWSSAARKAEDR